MSKNVFLNHKENPITLEQSSFASGGEGDIFRILHPSKYHGFVVKLYHPHKRTAEKEKKVRFLVNNPPDAQNVNGHNSVVWATGMIYDYAGFAGLMMPFAAGDKLEILTSSKISKKYRAEWGRFSFENQEAMSLRLAVCFNIAAAIYQIHQTGLYVLVDLKPDNIIVRSNGLVSIVDIDSMEVIRKNEVVYPAVVTTPEFAPPEFHGDVKPGQAPIYPSWDNYALGIIFYKLLFGIHPFAGSAMPPYDKLNTLQEKIEHGLFVHHPINRRFLTVIPPPHQRFENLAPLLQELFIQCFDEGHEYPNRRPTPSEWCSVISGKSLVQVKRPLPSRVLVLEKIDYSRPRPLPFATHSNINTAIIPKLQTLPPTTFKKTRAIELSALGVFGVAAFVIFKSPLMVMMAALATLIVTFNLRPEVMRKRVLKKRKADTNRLLYPQEALVRQLKVATTNHSQTHKKEIDRLVAKQYSLLHTERQAIDDYKQDLKQSLAEQDQLLIDLEEQEKAELAALMAQYEHLKAEETNDFEKIDIQLLNAQITETEAEITQIETLNGIDKKEDFVAHPFLLPIAHQLEKLDKTTSNNLRDIDLRYDKKIHLENKKLNLNTATTEVQRNDIYQKITAFRKEKIAAKEIVLKNLTARQTDILAHKQFILQQELQKKQQKLTLLKQEVERRTQNNSTSKGDFIAFEEAKKAIEDKYNAEYQTIITEGKKRLEKMKGIIAEAKEETANQTNILFSTALVPFQENSQNFNFEQEAKNLIMLKENIAQIESELKSSEDIDFWKYVEMVLTLT